jgi:hypothetical protein
MDLCKKGDDITPNDGTPLYGTKDPDPSQHVTGTLVGGTYLAASVA